MRIQFLTGVLLITFLFCGCNERPIYSKKLDIGGIWSYDNSLSFPLDVQQLDLTYDLILSLTYGRDFGYQNLYVKIETQYPSEKQTEDILSLNLTNGKGIFLGDCNSTKCEIDILLQEKFKFKEEGQYVITIIQNGREENLENVYAAELKLYRTQEK